MEPGVVQSAEVVIPCGPKLNETLSFFTGRLGFRVDVIYPADSPTVVVISGHGVCLRLEHGTHTPETPNTIRLNCKSPHTTITDGATELIAPNGSCIKLIDVSAPLCIPPLQQSFVLQRTPKHDDVGWLSGRAGMLYRDLIPNRQGGRFVASHIRIPDGGDVPDYVHYHKVRFQMIYCYKGWIRVTYEDQGEPLMVHAGDCLLQPPEIRHRVLQSSPGLEVIEIGCPAEIVTYADHEMMLPNSRVDRERTFSGQCFVHHQVKKAKWCVFKNTGMEYRDLGIGRATNGLAGVRVVRLISTDTSHESQNGSHGTLNGSHELQNGSHDLQNGAHDTCIVSHDYYHNGEFLFLFILRGEATLSSLEERDETMMAGECCVIPAKMRVTLSAAESADLEFLEVSLPPV